MILGALTVILRRGNFFQGRDWVMEVLGTDLEGVLLIKPHVFEDYRGEYIEIYNRDIVAPGVDFVCDCISISERHVLRGIHGDSITWKLVSCLYGRIYVVIVDCREQCDTFGKWQSFTLTERNKNLVLVPPKFGTSYLALSEKVVFYYKQSTYYKPYGQFTYKWNDPRFSIRWPILNPILSARDEVGHYV